MVSAEISRGKERESARKWEELKKQRNPCREESSEDRSRDEKKDKEDIPKIYVSLGEKIYINF